MSETILRVMCLGDVVGRAGSAALERKLKGWREQWRLDAVIVNAENAAGGQGIDMATADGLFRAGADVLTLGDHTYQKKEIKEYLDKNAARILRPANYPPGAPGKGAAIWRSSRGVTIGIANLMGRAFIGGALDCPFRAIDGLLAHELASADFRIVDFHAEATSEKVAFGLYVDGRVSVVFGTHTHVQTADEALLPQGTAYITDLGMCGPQHSVIGMDHETAITRFVSGLPASYKLGRGDAIVCGIIVELDTEIKSARSIARVREVVRL